MSTVKTNNVQIGQSVTATNNFTWYQPSSPDGTVRLGNGNAGSVTDLVTVNSSGNVGIGTSSPGAKLDVSGNVIMGPELYRSSATSYYRVAGGSAAATGAGITLFGESHASSPNVTTFFSGGTEKMRLDSSGNLGLGVTPSAWGSQGKAFQIGAQGAFAGYQYSAANNQVWFGNNCYVDQTTAFKYIAANPAANLRIVNDGAFQFNQAASGSAGGTISFTQAMTLGSDGNLLLGTTNTATNARMYCLTTNNAPSAYFEVSNTSQTASTLTIVSNRNTTNGSYRAIEYYNSGSANSRFIVFDSGSILSLGSYNNTTAIGANMTIVSSGDILRSTSSARYKNTITDAVHGLAEVLKLRPVTYKGNNDGDTVFGGLIAEEVHDAGLTEFVQYNNDGEPDALSYGNMVSLAFKAIQELSAELNEIKKRLS